MNVSNQVASALVIASVALAGCSGGGGADGAVPLNTDYSSLRVATSREGALVTAKTEEALLRPLRNGVRMSLNPGPVIAGLTAPPDAGQQAYSSTTLQVEGVDEADLVKYDGHYIYSVRPEAVPAKPGFTRNVLKIAKTDPATATLEVTTEFTIAGEHTSVPVVYQQQAADGATQYIAAISQNYQGWLTQQPQATSLVVMPDRTKVQLLDVRDPYNVSQAWEIEFDGWLRGSRKIGNVLYLVNSYRPRLAGIELPAQTDDIKRRNERRIRDATANELLPKYRVNGGAAQPYVATGDCVIAADLETAEAYTDLLVVTAVDLNERRVTDSACISTNMSGVYMSRDSLYVGGEAFADPTLASAFTVLHKFSLAQGGVTYRASGVVRGRLGWLNASYYMDEFQGDLRVVSSQRAMTGNDVHWLSVLRETANHVLELRARLPNERHLEPLGKPGDQVHAVRFDGDRAYVVTARAVDPLYVIDLTDSSDPFIAGELEIPGIATYLRPLEADDERLLLTVGRSADQNGMPQGFKVELFDVTQIDEPVSLGRISLGAPGTTSEAIDNPHALSIVAMPGADVQYRIALPLDVYAWIGANPSWSYSGMQLLEVDGNGAQPAQLRFHGMLRTDESSEVGTLPPFVTPRRGVIHDNAVYAVHGGLYASRKWR
jgi:hypothetical protein